MTSTTKGILTGLVSSLSFALMGLAVHQTARQYSSAQVLFIRGMFGVLVLAPFLSRKQFLRFFTKKSATLWLRALSGGLSVFCFFHNLRVVSVADATSLNLLSQVFILIFARIFLKETVTWKELLGIALIIAGSVLLVSPSGSKIPLSAVGIGVLGSVGYAGASVTLRKASTQFSQSEIVVCFCAVMAAIAVLMPEAPWKMPSSAHFVSLLIVSVMGLVAQLFMTLTYTFLKAPIAAVLSLSGLFWATLFDVVWLGYRPGPQTYLSYAVVLFGVFVIRFQK